MEVLCVKAQKRARIAIVVLAGLLAISITALAGILISRHYRAEKESSSVAPDNIITTEMQEAGSVSPDTAIQTGVSEEHLVEQSEGKSTVLALYRNHGEESTPFHAENMFPGDSLTRSCLVQISYKGVVTVHFHADIRSGYEKLAEVLKCRIVLQNGEELYDGLMRDMPSSIDYRLPQSEGNTVELSYSITAYLDTGVGNEYMNQKLIADFRWWVTETDELIPPVKTGDHSAFILWGTLVVGALFVLILLLLFRKRRKEDKHNE